MLNTAILISYEISDCFFCIVDILKDIRMPWDGPGLGPEYFAYG